MLKVYTKKQYIEKLTDEFNKCLDNLNYDTEMAFIDGYYDNVIWRIEKKIIPIIVKWEN